MRRDEVIAILREQRAELEKLGVAKFYLFGSVGRDTAHDFSDIDIIVDKADASPMDLFELARVKAFVEKLSGRQADVFSKFGVERSMRFKRRIGKDMIRVY